MISLDSFFRAIEGSPLAEAQSTLQEALNRRYYHRKHGDIPAWQNCLDSLPPLMASSYDLSQSQVRVGQSSDLEKGQRDELMQSLQGLHPWRKGPFDLFGIHIDTEWRSDWKWDRLLPSISPLAGRKVLDVGCGSGYHCWRMAGEGAEFVLGIDPSLKFLYQFHVLKHYLPESVNVHYLPLACEDLPPRLRYFDTVFSMGVIYHRRSPFEHLEELLQTLRPGGELVIESLVVPGDENTVLTPADRYAQMRNVWMIPSAHALARWVEKVGFKRVEVVDVTTTTADEQRRTDWMRFLSLSDFLATDDSNQTIEGYPAPTRAVLVAQKPF